MNPMDARTVAMIARAVSEDEATALIEQYGCMVASEAVAKAMAEACDRCMSMIDAAIETPLVRT
jgi:hypothetical protein